MIIRNDSSLLNKQATGGAIARSGMRIQDAVVLASLPSWIADPAFFEFVIEATGDIETKFFSTTGRPRIELTEVKKYELNATGFWAEIDRFKELDAASPGTFSQFRLVCGGVPANIHTLLNELDRLTKVGGFYQSTDGVTKASRDELESRVISLGRAAEDAVFLLSKVSVVADVGAVTDNGRAAFKDNFGKCFPSVAGSLNLLAADRLYESLAEMVAASVAIPVNRKQMEAAIKAALPVATEWDCLPLNIHTSGMAGSVPSGPSIRLDWARFFGEASRSYPNADRWNAEVVAVCGKLRVFFVEQHQRRVLHLTGERRLSTSFCLGACFPAVSGFKLECVGRDGVLRTDNHAGQGDTIAELGIEAEVEPGAKDLIIAVSAIRNIRDDVDRFVGNSSLARASRLFIHYPSPLTSDRHTNALVARIKIGIDKALKESGLVSCVHLFIAGPGQLALFLGYRWNALGEIVVHCYEWTGPGSYVQTCTLR